MTNYLDFLRRFLEKDDTIILIILTIILVVSLLDFVLGWLNAKFNKEISFSSSVALFGIIRKIVYFILLVIFIPIALLVPDPVGITTLYVLYGGYLLSEFQSLLAHLSLGEDDKTNQTFLDFLLKIGNLKKEETKK